ncbi:putative reverse transcriptase domain-containing protein, partial [Tanacetum coccineum]
RYAHLTQVVISRMIKESVNATIVAEQARHTNVGNDSTGSGPARGQDAAPAARECTFAGFMKCNPTAFHGPAFTWWNAKIATMGLETVNQMPWTEMKQLMTGDFYYTQRFNELALMCPRMVEPERVKVVAYIRGLTDNIKARDERILEAKKQKWESFQSRNSSGKGNHRDNSRQTLQNNQKQGNARAMVTAPTDGKVSSGSLPLCKRCFTRHDAEPKGPDVVTGTFLLNNHYAFVLFDSGSDRSFVDTRFSSILDIDPVKIGASYEVELADGRVVSMNTVLKGCTLNLVNHVFEIDLMPIELGTFDVIIGMDWLVKHDAIIVCGEKVAHIPYGNKMLIVESDKGVSRLKVISCIKARKYVERGCHLFLAYVTENKSKEKRMEDVLVIRDFLEVFPEVFPEELPGLPLPGQVEFRIDLVPGAAPVARAPYRLAPSEMRELSVQLQELLEKGFIRPSSSP